ncbi:hypothetical protein BV25DRAFT_1823342 [Artomyces pyxidatus]|uniref:Uncharacterized protein n=1 Tax=Artomyces pyxidatus TaxID=48021 RepID=A0ACB8T885_9AGAM|nr:hypothetical protein BV25DRAFT_1823342 [Artomyces pyxidatus]
MDSSDLLIQVLAIPLPSRAGLLPTIPSTMATARYAARHRVVCEEAVIAPAMHSSANAPVPSYSTLEWQRWVHPEGKPYYHRRSGLAIVTEADMSRPAVLDLLNSWVSVVEEIAKDNQIALHSSAELYLQFEEGKGDCRYYIVDHANWSIFWLQELRGDEVGLPQVVSNVHLSQALQTEYWNHVEVFCMHLPECPKGALDDLISQFIQGQTDQMTSTTSTFPYSVDDCVKYLSLLRRCREYENDGRTIWVVARLRCFLTENRRLTHYGETHCRLDVCDNIYEVPTIRYNRLLSVVSLMLFNLPETQNARLDGLFVDQVAYGYKWKAFNTAFLNEMKMNAIWTLGLLICNVMAANVSYTPMLPRTSILLCSASLIITTILHHQHQALSGMQPTQSHGWLAQHNTASRFKPLAIVYALPKALFVWALVLFVCQAFWAVFSNLSLVYWIVTAAVLFSVSLLIWNILSPPTVSFTERVSIFWQSLLAHGRVSLDDANDSV